MAKSRDLVLLCCVVIISVWAPTGQAGPTLVTPATESYLDHNHVIEYLSQSGPDGKKPSKLRLLLLNDLQKVAYEHDDSSLSREIDSNCVAVATFEVRTRNCKCESHKCSAETQSNTTAAKATITTSWKGSRHLQRNCESVCCQQPQVVAYSSGIGNDHETAACPDLLKQIVKITKLGHTNAECVGRLIRPNVVLTTMICDQMLNNDNQFSISREHETETILVERKVTPENFAILFDQIGLNIALLVLNKPIDDFVVNSKCFLPISSDYSGFGDCFVATVPYADKSPVTILANERCTSQYHELFHETANFCVGDPNGKPITNLPHGAPLICKVTAGRSQQMFVEVGMLSWSSKNDNRNPYMFSDVRFSLKWIDELLNNL